MKAIRRNISPWAFCAGAALSALLSACVAPVQAPVPAARPPQVPLPRVVPPAPVDWHDLPATPGVWQWHREGPLSIARFGVSLQPALFSLTCDKRVGTINLARSDGNGTATTMAISTTSLSRTLAIRRQSDGTLAAPLPARDPLLDAMAYSRGRFAAEVPGLVSLYLPSWPEVGRVIEDCRG